MHKGSDEVLDAPSCLAAQHKSALLLKSKGTFENLINVDGTVEVYNETEIGNKYIWTTSRTALSIDRDSLSVALPGKAGKRATVTIDDIRLSIPHDSFANTVKTTIRELDDTIEQHNADIS